MSIDPNLLTGDESSLAKASESLPIFTKTASETSKIKQDLQSDSIASHSSLNSKGLDIKKLSIEGYSIQPERPSIPSPKDLANLKKPSTISTDATQVVAKDQPIPAHAVPFLAILSSIMDEVFDTASKNRRTQADIAINQYKNIVSFTKSGAELTKFTYHQKSLDLIMQSTNSAINGAISLGQVVQNTRNVGLAEQDPKIQELDTNIEKKKLEISQLEQGPVGLGDNAAPNAAPDAKAIKGAKAELEKFTSERASVYSEKLQTLNLNTRLGAEAFQAGAGGFFQSGRAVITTAEGAAEASKQMNDGYRQAAQTMYDTSSRLRDESKGEVNKTADSLTKIISESFAASRVSRG